MLPVKPLLTVNSILHLASLRVAHLKQPHSSYPGVETELSANPNLQSFSNLQQARRKAKTKDRALCPERSTASNFGYAVPRYIKTKKQTKYEVCIPKFTTTKSERDVGTQLAQLQRSEWKPLHQVERYRRCTKSPLPFVHHKTKKVSWL